MCIRDSTLKKAVLCNNMMQELRSKDGFDRVPLFIDNTSALHVAGHRTFSTRAKPIALTYFVQELVQEGTITIHHVKTQDQLADIGTKHPNKQPGTYQQNQGLWSLNGNEDLVLDLGSLQALDLLCEAIDLPRALEFQNGGGGLRSNRIIIRRINSFGLADN